MIRRIEHLSDAVIEIESWAGSIKQVNAAYTTEYHGLIHPLKLFGTQSYTTTTRLSNIQLHSLGFKVRRKRFSVETFHLPPEDDEPTTSSGNLKPTGSSNIGGKGTPSMDF